MPPGDRPKLSPDDYACLAAWIKEGAQNAPELDLDGYVLWWISRDLQSVPKEDLPYVRYINFEEGYREDPNSDRAFVAKKREGLEFALPKFRRGAGVPKVHQVDSSVALFRIDLRKLGWERHPYPPVDKSMYDLSLYDLILLEYPYGELPLSFVNQFPTLHTFLENAKQARPVLYLRGDWLLAALNTTPLLEDFFAVLKPGDAPKPGPQWPGPPPLRRAGRLPIYPIDSLSARNVPPTTEKELDEFDVKVALIRFRDKERTPLSHITDKDKLDYDFYATKKAWVEFYRCDNDQKFYPLPKKDIEQNWAILDEKKSYNSAALRWADGFTLGTDPGRVETNHIIVFALDYRDIGKFPTSTTTVPGSRLQAPGVRDRIFHDWYRFPPKVDRWPIFIKRTFTFDVREAE